MYKDIIYYNMNIFLESEDQNRRRRTKNCMYSPLPVNKNLSLDFYFQNSLAVFYKKKKKTLSY